MAAAARRAARSGRWGARGRCRGSPSWLAASCPRCVTWGWGCARCVAWGWGLRAAPLRPVAQSASAVLACALCYEAVNTTGFVDNTLGSSLTLTRHLQGYTRFALSCTRMRAHERLAL